MTGKFIFGRIRNCVFEFGSSPYNANSFPVETITPRTNWYNLKIEVANNKNVNVYVDNALKGSFTAYFNTRGIGGVGVVNRYANTCLFRDFKIEPIN